MKIPKKQQKKIQQIQQRIIKMKQLLVMYHLIHNLLRLQIIHLVVAHLIAIQLKVRHHKAILALRIHQIIQIIVVVILHKKVVVDTMF